MNTGGNLMLAYIYDEKLKKTINNQGRNYWEAYIEEILDLIGANAKTLSLDEISDAKKLNEINTLIIGSQSGKQLDAEMCNILRSWVNNGGILIGFSIDGLEEVFGIEYLSDITQIPDDYSISGYYEM
jgi:hypothetical protein